MREKKWILGLATLFVLIFMLNIIWVSAATTLSSVPGAKVEYGYSDSVQVGTIRYISQINSNSYFYSNYWGQWKGQAGTECGTASISMALSYIGINKTPQAILDAHNGLTVFTDNWGGASYSTPNLSSAISNYVDGGGKYSPPVIWLQYYGSTTTHWVIIAGKVSSNVYQIIDPANSNVWNMTINGNTASYGNCRNGSETITGVYQYYNPNAVIKPIEKYDPEGTVDHVVSQQIVQTINIKGWAFDRDDLSASLNIFVYIGGEAGSQNAEEHVIVANGLREDILAFYPGVGSYHGFQENIVTSKTGQQNVFIYASNSGKNTPDTLIGTFIVTLKSSSIDYNPEKTIDEGIYSIVSCVDQNYELTVDNNSDNNSSNIHIWSRNDDNNYSKWRLLYVGDGYYKIKNIGSGKCIDVNGGTSALSANVMQYEDHGGDNQLWRIFAVDDGYVLQPKCAVGACLDLDQNIAKDYQNVSISNEHLNINQKWLFSPTETIPTGQTDHIVSEQTAQTINIKGWAFDRGDIQSALNILICIGGKKDETSAEKHTIKANKLREDILEYYGEIGNEHGFQESIVTSKVGSQSVYVYASNAGKDNAKKLIGSATVVISQSTHQITYDANGGTINGNNTATAEYGKPYGTMPSCTREGYQFTGWFTTPDGTSRVTENSICKGDITLYAHWESGNSGHTHIYEEMVETEATCTEPGVIRYTCTECGDYYTEEIPAAGHSKDFLLSGDKEATCTEEGYTGDAYCLDCGELLQKGNVIKALDHVWDAGVVTKEATETTEGIRTYTCTVCNTTKEEMIPATGNSPTQPTDPKPTQQPTTPKPTVTQQSHKSHVGKTFVVNGLKYKVTKDDTAGREVRVTSMVSDTDTLNIPATVTNAGWKESFKVTSIKAKAFKNKSFAKAVIGNNVTKIGPNAFYHCWYLQKVVIGKSVKSIGVRAFYKCDYLKKVNIKSTVLTTVKKNAFKKLYWKAVIKVPKGKKKAYKGLLKGKIDRDTKIK